MIRVTSTERKTPQLRGALRESVCYDGRPKQARTILSFPDLSPSRVLTALPLRNGGGAAWFLLSKKAAHNPRPRTTRTGRATINVADKPLPVGQCYWIFVKNPAFSGGLLTLKKVYRSMDYERNTSGSN